jgi:hypothetical protein
VLIYSRISKLSCSFWKSLWAPIKSGSKKSLACKLFVCWKWAGSANRRDYRVALTIYEICQINRKIKVRKSFYKNAINCWDWSSGSDEVLRWKIRIVKIWELKIVFINLFPTSDRHLNFNRHSDEQRCFVAIVNTNDPIPRVIIVTFWAFTLS